MTAALGVEKLDAVADRGYFNSEEIRACEEAGITVTLPKPMTSNAKAEGRFGKQDFRYVADDDIYVCPAGEKLAYHYTTEENSLVLRRYWTNVCQSCAIKPTCTTGKEADIAARQLCAISLQRSLLLRLMRYTFSRLRGLPRRSVPSALKECCSGIIVPPDSRQWHLDLCQRRYSASLVIVGQSPSPYFCVQWRRPRGLVACVRRAPCADVYYIDAFTVRASDVRDDVSLTD